MPQAALSQLFRALGAAAGRVCNWVHFKPDVPGYPRPMMLSLEPELKSATDGEEASGVECLENREAGLSWHPVGSGVEALVGTIWTVAQALQSLLEDAT